MSATENIESPLSLSVIIPVYNDGDGLRDTLESLLAQDVPASDFEVIIADNGSTDGTWELARQYVDEHGELIKAVQEAQIQSSYAARNRGIENSDGEVLCFLDADMTAPIDYIRLIRKRFTETNVDYLACDVWISARGDAQNSNLGSLYNCLTGFPVECYLERGNYAPTCCLSVRRSVIDDLGPFDDRLESGGDMEFGQRVFGAGLNMKFAGEITLHHPPRNTFRALVNKQKRIARGHAQLSHLYPSRYSLFSKLYLKTTRYFHPSNPLRLKSKCKERDLNVDFSTALALSTLQIPLAWAGIYSYIREARRLSEESEQSEQV